MKSLIKECLGKIKTPFLERILQLSLLNNEYKQIRLALSYQTREEIWEDVNSRTDEEPVTFLEFGVFKGYSINYFSKMNSNINSKFYGFDSFTGLPHDWSASLNTSGLLAGAFDTGGRTPTTKDIRIKFFKGWLQNTLPEFLKNQKLSGHLIIHFDLDLYGGTIFALSEVDKLKRPYYAIFDEFAWDEVRALYNYQQMSGAKVEFLGKAGDQNYPTWVSAKISPVEPYCPAP